MGGQCKQVAACRKNSFGGKKKLLHSAPGVGMIGAFTRGVLI